MDTTEGTRVDLRAAQSLADNQEYEKLRMLLRDCGMSTDTQDVRARILVLRARANLILGDWEAAEVEAREVVSMGETLADRSTEVAAWQVIGEFLKDRGRTDESMECHLKASRLAGEIGDVMAGAEAELGLAGLCSKAGDMHHAQVWFEKARKAIERLEGVRARRLKAVAAIHMGIEAFRLSHLEEMSSWCHQALSLLQGVPPNVEAAEAYRFLGVAASARRQHKQALEFHTAALEVINKVGWTFGLAKVYNSIGQTFLEMGRSQEAIHFMEKSEGLCLELGATGEAATLLGKLGRAHFMREEYDHAVAYSRRDLETSRDGAGKRALAHMHRNLGQGLRETGELAQAIPHLKESLKLFHEVNDSLNLGRVYQELCLAYLRMNETVLSRTMANKAFEAFNRIRHEHEAMYVRTLLGAIQRMEGELTESEATLEKALAYFATHEPSSRRVETLYEYGLLQLDQGMPDHALETFGEALRLSQKLNLQKRTHQCFSMIEKLDAVRFMRTLMETA